MILDFESPHRSVNCNDHHATVHGAGLPASAPSLGAPVNPSPDHQGARPADLVEIGALHICARRTTKQVVRVPTGFRRERTALRLLLHWLLLSRRPAGQPAHGHLGGYYI
jgi:hypothetical protein